MANGRAGAAEIWAALAALRAGQSVKDVAAQTGRSTGTLSGWNTKYASCASLTDLEAIFQTRYIKIMRRLFEVKYKPGDTEFAWERSDLSSIADELGIEVPSNLGDNIYSVRHGREDLPEAIRQLAPAGKAWLLLPNGKSAYKFVLADRAFLDPDPQLMPIKIPDSTPQIVANYAKRDEQAVLARIRYCRLVDMFMGLASYQLQSHMRTTVEKFNKAQTELDEIYVGVDGNGTQFVIPIQAKAANERIGTVQIVTDHHACAEKFPRMIARTVAAKTVRIETDPVFGDIYTIALLEAGVVNDFDVWKMREAHFQLLPSAMISDDDLQLYRRQYRPPSPGSV